MTHDDTLEDDLRALGEPLRAERAGDALVDRIAAVVGDAPVPQRRRADVWIGRFTAWWRWCVAGIAGLLVLVLLVPPIRATVVDWFGFGGVIVRESPSPGPTDAPEPPTIDSGMSLAHARGLVDFEVRLPSALGRPDAVDVTNKRRILSMSWDTSEGNVRLDQFDGAPKPVFMKEIYSDADVADVRGAMALWFDEPHEVVVLGDDGTSYETPPRLAGSTLIWQRGDTTLRLEGDLGRQHALEVARSVGDR